MLERHGEILVHRDHALIVVNQRLKSGQLDLGRDVIVDRGVRSEMTHGIIQGHELLFDVPFDREERVDHGQERTQLYLVGIHSESMRKRR